MPSRRRLLTALSVGLGTGAVGGYVAGARPFAAESVDPPEQLAAAPTEWPFRDYDRAHTRNPPPQSAPSSTLRERWRHPLGEDEYAAGAPVVGNGQVVLPVSGYGRRDGERLSLHALDLASGDRDWVWRTSTRSSVFDVPIAAVGDSVFCGSETTDGDMTVALAAATGSDRWQRPREALGPGVLTAAGHLLTIQRADSEAVSALDARTGEPRWQWSEEEATRPAFDGERIVLGTDDSLVGLDPDTGAERWRSDVPDSLQWGPALAGGRAFVGTTSGELAAYDTVSGDRLWRRDLADPVTTDDGTTYARWVEAGAVTGAALVVVERRFDAAADLLHVRDPTDGTLQFTGTPAAAGDTRFVGPVVVDGTVFVGEQNEEADGGVTAFDLVSGTRTTRARLGGVKSLLVTDGKVLAETTDALIALW